MSIEILGVVPARSGSKGLPGKNTRPLAGLPLIAHSLRCAALARSLRRVIVSTDSEDIAKVAREHGGDVPFLRPAELATDSAPLLPVLADALRQVEKADGRRYDAVLLLDPTSPGRLPGEIDAAAELLATNDAAEGVVACSRPDFNPFWVGCTVEAGYLQPAFAAASGYTRRQEVPSFYRINGSLYLLRREFLLGGAAHVLAGKMLLLEIPEQRALSIDTLEQFEIAELMIREGLIRLPWIHAAASEEKP
jgi:CMP-N,N'-diacetyllegionaminic acid synthase